MRFSDEAFLNFRKAAALPIAYTQMLSMAQLGLLEQLARLRTQAAAAPTPAAPSPPASDSGSDPVPISGPTGHSR